MPHLGTNQIGTRDLFLGLSAGSAENPIPRYQLVFFPISDLLLRSPEILLHHLLRSDSSREARASIIPLHEAPPSSLHHRASLSDASHRKLRDSSLLLQPSGIEVSPPSSSLSSISFNLRSSPSPFSSLHRRELKPHLSAIFFISLLQSSLLLIADVSKLRLLRLLHHRSPLLCPDPRRRSVFVIGEPELRRRRRNRRQASRPASEIRTRHPTRKEIRVHHVFPTHMLTRHPSKPAIVLVHFN